jgi:hypothetical protein
MYYVQYDMKESTVSSAEGLSQWGTTQYEGYSHNIDERNLPSRKEIQDYLENIGIESSEENVQTAEKLLVVGEPINQENMEKIISIHEGLHTVIEKMDYQKAAKMLQQGIELEKSDIRQLAEQMVKDFGIESNNGEKNIDVNQKLAAELEKAMAELSKSGEIKQEDLVKLLKERIDISLNRIENVSQPYLMGTENQMDNFQNGLTPSNGEKFFVRGVNKILDLSQMFHNVKNLSFQTITAHLRKGVPITLHSIQQQVNETTMVETGKILESGPIQEDQTLDFISQNKLSLQSVLLSQGWQRAIDMGKSLLHSGLQLSISSLRQVDQAYSQYSKIRNNLTSTMVLESVEEGRDLENLELTELCDYVMDKAVNEGQEAMMRRPVSMKRQDQMSDIMEKSILQENQDTSKSKMTQLVKDIQQIGEEEEEIIPMLLMNEMEFSLKEIQQVSSFMKNQQQLGQQIHEVLQQTGMVQDIVLKEKLQKLEQLSKKVSDKLKNGDQDLTETYQSLITLVKDMQDEGSCAQEEGNQDLQQQMETMLDCLDMQNKLNKKNMVFQFPVYVNGEMTNLQMAMLQDYRIKSKTNQGTFDMAVNLHTKHLGQIQGTVHFEGKKVSIEMTVAVTESKEKLQVYLPVLREGLKEVGYTLSNVDFIETAAKSQNKVLSKRKLANNRGWINYEI